MRTRDIVSSLFWIGVGAVFCIGAVQNGILLSPGVPGPGCLAFIVGSILIVLSFLVLMPALFSGRSGARKTSQESFFPEKESFRKLFLALLSLSLYAVALEPLGFLVATLLFLILVLRFIEPQKWVTVFGFSLTAAFLTRALFTALKVELPTGFLGI
jgi:putative tricarboxylic transport membrane protein